MATGKLEDYKKKVNPKIAKDIENLIKPYWNLIDKSSDYYKLKTLAINVDKLNIKVNQDVEKLLMMFKIAAGKKILKKIKRIHDSDKSNDYGMRNVGAFSKKHKLGRRFTTQVFYSIHGDCMVNLSLEDFKFITNNAKKAIFYSFEVISIGGAGEIMKPKLKGMKNAILIMTGNNETTLDELNYVWEQALHYLPKDSKTTFAYKIEDIKKMQLDLLTVK